MLCAQSTPPKAADQSPHAEQLFDQGRQQLFEQGQPENAARTFEQALSIYRSQGNRHGEAKALDGIGGAYIDLGAYDKAIEYFQQSLSIARQIADRSIEAGAIYGLGNSHKELSKTKQALEYYQQSLSVAREINDLHIEGKALSSLANIFVNQGDHAKAIDYYKQSLEIARQLKSRSRERIVLNNLSGAYVSIGNYAQAIEHLQQSLLISREMNNRLAEGKVMANMGAIFFVLGEDSKAIEYYEQVLIIAKEFKNPALESHALTALAEIHQNLGSYDLALDLLQRSLSICQEIKDLHGEADNLLAFSMVHSSLGRHIQALHLAQKSLLIYQEIEAATGIIYAQHLIGNIYLKLQNFSLALQYLQRGLEHSQNLALKGHIAFILNDMGDLVKLQSQWKAALNYYQQALSIVQDQESQNNFLAAVILNNLGNLQERQGELAEARKSFRLAAQADPKNGIAANNYIRVGKQISQAILAENQQEAGRYCDAADSAASAYSLSQCALALLQTDRPGQAFLAVGRGLDKAQGRSEKSYALYLKGAILTALERTADAKAAFASALAEQPQPTLEADIYLALGLLDANAQQLDCAKALDPTIAQVSSIADLGSRNRSARISVPAGGREQKFVEQQAYVPPIYRRLLINGQPVLLLVDTGAAYSLLNDESRARTGIRPLPATLQVAYADGRKEQLKRYRPDSIALPEKKGRVLKTEWVLGSSGKENLLGRDLLRQMLSAKWFTEAQGK